MFQAPTNITISRKAIFLNSWRNKNISMQAQTEASHDHKVSSTENT